MNSADTFRLLFADLILIVHFAFVVFVVGGFALILAGRWSGWHWVYARRFRLGHLAAIGFVVIQSWLGQLCPLTIWENALRRSAGNTVYEETFIQHWLHQWLYYEVDFSVFVIVYTLFGVAVAAVTWRDRRRIFGQR